MTQNTKLHGFIAQLSKFGAVGALMTAFGITANYILLEILHLPLYPVYVAVFLAGVLLSYLLNSRFTFKEKINIKAGARYYVSYLIGLLFSLTLLYIFDKTLLYSDFILTVFVIPPRFLLTFFLVKKVVFKIPTSN